jgi:hypothetical protein
VRSRSVIVALGSLLIGAQAAAEADPAQVAAGLKAEGFRQFAQGHYEAGIQAMERAYATARAPDFLLNVAVAYDKWGHHCQEALEALQRYFAACAACTNQEVAQAKFAELTKKCEVDLAIDTEPSGSLLRVDHAPLALETPVRLRLARGVHRATVIHPGSPPIDTSFVVGPKLRRLVFAVEPQRPVPPLVLKNLPAGVEVDVDGRRVDPEDGVLNLASGNHTVLIKMQGGVPDLSFETTLFPGQTQEIDEWSPGDKIVFASTMSPPAPPDLQAAGPQQGQDRGVRTWAWIGLGLGVVGAAVGTVFSVTALQHLDRAHQLEQGAMPDPHAVNSELTTYGQHFTFAELGFGGALLGAAVGLSLLAFSSGSGASK